MKLTMAIAACAMLGWFGTSFIIAHAIVNQ